MRLKRHQEEQGNVRKKDFRSRTPELQREGKKIMTTPRLILSFFLTTLKNRWTFLPCIFFFFLFYFTIFSLRCLVECVYRSALFRFYIYIYFCLFRYDSGMPPQSQKKKCHTTDRFLTVLFVIALSAKNVSRFFFFPVLFFWLIVSHVVVCGEHRGWKWGSVGRTKGKKTSRKIVQNAKEHAKGKATKNCSVYRERKKYKDQKASFNVLSFLS